MNKNTPPGDPPPSLLRICIMYMMYLPWKGFIYIEKSYKINIKWEGRGGWGKRCSGGKKSVGEE